jgi:hypothetical protein
MGYPLTDSHQPDEYDLDLTNPLQGDPISSTPKWQQILQVTQQRSPKFFEILVESADLHNRKNLNYAGVGDDPFANFRETEKFSCPYCGEKIPAWLGVAIRISDKYSRFCNLLGGIPDMVGESIKDTDIDLSVYSKIFKILYEEWEEKQKEQKANK